MASTTESPPSKDGYLLNRDFYAATRLNCQHWLWCQELRYNLHPAITVPSSGNIADVATGTGAWLLEVAREHPKTRCDGFDISIEQAPPSVWLPPNISMRTWNMYESPPKELIGVYDVVHIRLVGIAVRSDPVPVLENLTLLLKPHGWLQWDELDINDTIIVHAHGESGKTEAVQKMDKLMKGHGAGNWILKLPAMMTEKVGFSEATIHRVKPELRFLKAYTDMHVGSWVELASNQPEGSEKRKDFEQLAADLQDEVRQGAAHGVTKVICVGRKSA